NRQLDGLEIIERRPMKELRHDGVPEEEHQGGLDDDDSRDKERDLPAPAASGVFHGLVVLVLDFIFIRVRHKSPLNAPVRGGSRIYSGTKACSRPLLFPWKSPGSSFLPVRASRRCRAGPPAKDPRRSRFPPEACASPTRHPDLADPALTGDPIRPRIERKL